MKYVLSYDDVTPELAGKVGGKGRNTAVAYQNGFQVPPGLILGADAFMLSTAGLADEISTFFSPEIANADVREACERLRSFVIAAEISEEVRSELHAAFDELVGKSAAGLIARSSATVEDMPRASMAGLLTSIPNIRTFDDLMIAVRKCWASIFTSEARIYLQQRGLLGADVGVAVLIQAMIPAERSGIVFSMDAVTGDTDKVIVDAIFGLAEEIVSGEVTPERYIYSRRRGTIVSRNLGRQAELITPSGERKPVDVMKEAPRLSDDEVYELATIGIKLEELFGKPQDVEWAFSNGAFYVLQSRPIVLGERYQKLFPQIGEHTVLLHGSGVSPAVGSGRVHIIATGDVTEVDTNTVVVAQRITNELAVHLRHAAAVVTDEGGATSHGANILREFGVPCVLGTGTATEKLKDGQIVTVDGLRGVVYEGDLGVRIADVSSVPHTETKVFLSILIPEKARTLAPLADGVSSLRDDYFMFESGTHPIAMIKQGYGMYLEDSIANGVMQTLAMFAGKPVWYKTMDAPTDEFRRLKGAEDPEERNPLFGWRGIGRELEEREMLLLELKALRRALSSSGGGNLGVKLPFIRFVDELVAAKEAMREVGLRPHEDIKVGISVENPAVVFTLADFIDEGVDFVSVGLSDLVMCTLALDRESQKVAPYFKPNHPAVLSLLDEIASQCKRHNIFSCVAGESARDPNVLPHLIEDGFNAIGVSLSFFSDSKHEIALVERNRRSPKRAIG